MKNRLLLSTFLLTAAGLANAQSSLPPKMDGRWTNTGSNHSNKIEVEAGAYGITYGSHHQSSVVALLSMG